MCVGLDPSGYRSNRVEEDATGAVEDVDGRGTVQDPFEGTEGLHVTCAKCAESTVLQGPQVSMHVREGWREGRGGGRDEEGGGGKEEEGPPNFVELWV